MATDNFNRANETPLASPWVADSVVNAPVWLRSNVASGSTGSKGIAYYSGSVSKDSTVTFASFDNNNSGPCICLDGAGSGYGSDAGNYLIRFDSGTPNFISGPYGAISAGDTVRLYRDGNDVVTVVNGSEVGRYTDTTYMTGYDGLFVQEMFERFGSGWGSQLDNWASGGGGGGSPTLSDVDTDEIVNDGQTGVAVTGTLMGTTNANRTFSLVQGGGPTVVPQTETGTGTATAATVSIAVDQTGADIKFGSATFRVTRTADSLFGDIVVTVNPPTGQIYVDVGTPDTTSAYRITAVSDIVSGDQIQGRGVGSGSVPTGLSIASDGTWSFSSGNTPANFDVRIWDQSDSTWGAWATQTAAAAPVGTDTISLTDSAVAVAQHTRTGSDTITLTDSAAGVANHTVAGTDTVSLTDSAVGALSGGAQVASDSITLTDSADEVGLLTAIGVDTVSLSDSAVARTTTITVTASDGLSLFDSAIGTGGASLTPQSTPGSPPRRKLAIRATFKDETEEEKRKRRIRQGILAAEDDPEEKIQTIEAAIRAAAEQAQIYRAQIEAAKAKRASTEQAKKQKAAQVAAIEAEQQETRRQQEELADVAYIVKWLHNLNV